MVFFQKIERFVFKKLQQILNSLILKKKKSQYLNEGFQPKRERKKKKKTR